MFKLSFIILISLLNICYGQSPHGNNFNISCENCHYTESWKIELQKIKFNHNETEFSLTGQHSAVECKSCHINLVFDNTSNQCSDCHKDIHENTVGIDCARCHESSSWLVNKITEIHQMSRFPLLGSHLTADCNQCHISSSAVKFEPVGVECKFCHTNDYYFAKNPDHIAAGFSLECHDCHDINSIEWSMSDFAHNFFPLVDAHNIANCFQCHQQSNFSGLSQECLTCHQNDYNSAANPNHVELSFSSDCKQCHTLSLNWNPAEFLAHDNIYPLGGAHAQIKNDCNKCHANGYSNTPNQCIGCHQNDYNSTANPSHVTLNFSTDCETCHSLNSWKPATFDHDGQYFPIYSGEHAGEWKQCSDCHVDANNYANFSCVTCHEHNQNEMDNEHIDVSGYVYESNQCFACHPTGRGDGTFNHAASAFPLIGMHAQVSCVDCHSSGYQGTSSECFSCHQNDFQNTVNPNHQSLSLDVNCELCHSFEPGWSPAQFPIHNNYYELLGAHASLSDDCTTCHNNDYNNTPNQCIGCHQQDYDQTTDPQHQSSGFATECGTCHTQDAWRPANFEHDGQYFPIYSGEHAGQWNVCSDCHVVQNNYGIFECVSCHEHNRAETDNKHVGISGYIYVSRECLACHPTGNGDGSFNHTLSNFPLTGSHTILECNDCHSNGYAGTSNQCYSCHQTNYQETTNPSHQNLSLDTSCETCHTTEPGWSPAQFPIHNNYYELLGAHVSISNDCTTCHNNDYNNTPNQCVGCHQQDYDQTTDPQHSASGFLTDCESCHTQNSWKPATFDHDGQYFPIYSGEHNNEWNTCSDCHNVQSNFKIFECINCHEHNKNEMDGEHNGVNNYVYLSTACYDCHPDGKD